MTAITTAEELEGIVDGGTIRVNDPRNGIKTWTRNGDRFYLSGNGTALPLVSFIPALARGVVETGPLFTARAVLTTTNGYERIVLRVRSDGTADVLQVYNRTGVEAIAHIIEREPHWTQRTEADDERIEALRAAGMLVLAANDRVTQVSESITALRDQHRRALTDIVSSHDGVMSSLNADLIEAYNNFDDEDDKAALSSVLREHGLESPSRNVEFTIRISGTVEQEIEDDSAAREAIGRVDTIDEAKRTISFTHSIEVNEAYSGDNADPCEDREVINDEWVRNHLDDANISYDDVSIENRSCSEC